jgi:hypothetical protein
VTTRSVSLAPIINAEDTDQVGRLKAEKDPPFTDSQTQFSGAVFERLDIAVACCSEPNQGGIDPCLNDAIQSRQIA